MLRSRDRAHGGCSLRSFASWAYQLITILFYRQLFTTVSATWVVALAQVPPLSVRLCCSSTVAYGLSLCSAPQAVAIAQQLALNAASATEEYMLGGPLLLLRSRLRCCKSPADVQRIRNQRMGTTPESKHEYALYVVQKRLCIGEDFYWQAMAERCNQCCAQTVHHSSILCR
jgi:hypothetical protein